MNNLTFCLLAIFLFLGCSNKNLPEYTKLGDLRVLFLISEPPEVSPGDSVVITPVLSDLTGLGRTLTYKAYACPDPGIGYGATPSCARSTAQVSLGGGSLTLSSPKYTEAVTPLNVTVPGTLLESYSSAQQLSGVAYLVTYEITAADGASVQSFKRIVVTSPAKTPKNQNPSSPSILVNGATLSALPTAQSTMTLALASGTVGSSLATTWFVSDGTFERFRTIGTDSLTYTPPTTLPSGRSVVITIVVRDGSGGKSYKIYGF